MAALVLTGVTANAGPIPAGFNDAGLKWHDLSDGLAAARAADKPVFMLVHAT